MTSKTYGRLLYSDAHRVWGVEADPHVMIRLKRIFPRVLATRTGLIQIAATPDVARDLEWVTERWALTMDPEVEARLHADADEQRWIEEQVTRIFDGHKLDGEFRETARPPRWEHQERNAELISAVKRLLITDSLGGGKAQPLDSPVLTPSGFVPMGTLVVGSAIVAADGSATIVTAVHPQGEIDCYEVTFSDGATIRCSDDHLWTVRHCSGPTRSKTTGRQNPIYWKTATLRELMVGGLQTSDGQAKWHIPIAAATNLDAGGDRPLDPYLLGVLLGDGCFRGKDVTITSADPEIPQMVSALLPTGVEPGAPKGFTVRLVNRCPRRRPSGHWTTHPVIDALKSLGLWGHLSLSKFVPESYKLARSSDRLALLQGLMDTDGWAADRASPRAEFYSSSEQLALDVQWLVESLGGVGRLRWKMFKGRKRYTVNVKLPQPLVPFRLPRKADRWGDGHATLKPTRALVSAVKVGTAPMQCITISHPSQLYVTDRFAVTHNSWSGASTFRNPDALPGVVVVPTHLQRQWVEEIAASWPDLHVHIVAKGQVYDPSFTRDARGRGRPDILVITYGKLGGWADHLAGEVNAVIFDEVQELRNGVFSGGKPIIKGTAAAQIADKANYVVGLTATPVTNYGGDLHNLFSIIKPDVLGERPEFLREWCGDGASSNKPKVKDPKALSLYLRDMGAMTGVKLPGIEPLRIEQRVDHDVDVYEKGMGDAAEMARFILSSAGTNVERLQAAGELDNRIRQITGLSKAPYVALFVRLLLESVDKVVLWGWHRAVYDVWLEKLDAHNPVLYTGSESPGQKIRAIEAFRTPNDDGGAQVLIMSLRSGTGVNGLQNVCHTGVFGELDWTPAAHSQCVGRLNRPGQEVHPVLAYFLTSDIGSDPPMIETLGVKKQQAEPIEDPTITRITPLINDTTDRVRLLARAVLEQRGEPIPEVDDEQPGQGDDGPDAQILPFR